MLYAFSIFFTLCTAVRADMMRDLFNAVEICMEQYSTINFAVLYQLKQCGDLTSFQTTYPEINCFMTCVGRKLELFDENGVIDLPKLKTFTMIISDGAINEDAALETVETCVASTSENEDLCNRVGKYALCKIEQLKSHSVVFSKSR